MAIAATSKNPDFSIRTATEADIPAIREIYAHHVLKGLGSFEVEPPSVEEMTKRMRTVAEANMPYIVAERAGEILGYSYGAPYRPRPAYRYTVENSVYVHPDATRRGIGRALLAALIEHCTERGFRQMVAVIGDSGNSGSIGLHSALGFRSAGVVVASGYKFGRWVDSVIMQRALGPGATTEPGG